MTITSVSRKDYNDGTDNTKGVVITTKEVFPIDGEPFSKFHTTRQALVGKFLNDAGDMTILGKAINDGGELKVKVVSKKNQAGNRNYFDFEQC
jgi:hypothetical protein